MGHDDARVVSIVDDDESLRRSVRNLLMSVGFRVETFDSAEAYLRAPDREETGCLLLDLRMPGMSGLDLLGHLSAAGSRVPVVVLTAHSDAEARRKTLYAGAIAFLGKPFHGDALLDAVRSALAEAEPCGGPARRTTEEMQ
jgi:FixJ family two-component response regulator